MSTDLAEEERRFAIVTALALCLAASAIILFKPGHSEFLPPCFLHAVTGFSCPGCGTTRALWYLLHGHLLLALGENALSILLLPYVLYDLGATLTRRWRTISSQLPPWSVWAVLTAIILFSVLRNVPMSPFTLLAPTDIR